MEKIMPTPAKLNQVASPPHIVIDEAHAGGPWDKRPTNDSGERAVTGEYS